ncbi:hypothetical protein VQL36_16225 [Chengkuizengella sp. SCS-71B]|uniref:hypothetical protein n=1 Tax=Chengkuizengella sp. SCS-71B TaxID=3115290 RepID=UPI0032C24B89
MGHFDESICNCCVCPMQCVLKQFIGETVGIETPVSFEEVTIFDVKDFIVFTSAGDYAICNISSVFIEFPFSVELKPLKKSTGECACCEDPMANFLNSQIDQIFDIEFIGEFGGTVGQILNVGEGIVLQDIGLDETLIISICTITRAVPSAASSAQNIKSYKKIQSPSPT